MSICFISAFITWACDLKSTFLKSIATMFVVPVVARHTVMTHDGVKLAHSIVVRIVVAVVTLYAVYVAWKSYKFFKGKLNSYVDLLVGSKMYN